MRLRSAQPEAARGPHLVPGRAPAPGHDDVAPKLGPAQRRTTGLRHLLIANRRERATSRPLRLTAIRTVRTRTPLAHSAKRIRPSWRRTPRARVRLTLRNRSFACRRLTVPESLPIGTGAPTGSDRRADIVTAPAERWGPYTSDPPTICNPSLVPGRVSVAIASSSREIVRRRPSSWSGIGVTWLPTALLVALSTTWA